MPTSRREALAFSFALAALVSAFQGESLLGGKILSPADVVYVQASFREFHGPDYEPANRLLMDPVLQFQPWLEFNRAMLRQGRLPLWNGLAGFGAPHLANGQSAVFDPFHLIAYLGTLPEAHAWMAAARLWMAGLGMFLLARRWGLGPWGRWFAGLSFPFCGFLVVWLLYPVTSTAVWLPWLFLATESVLERPRPRAVGVLAVVVGTSLLGGHVQTAAHMLLAAGLYATWRVARRRIWRSRTERYPSDDLAGDLRCVAPHALAGWLAGVALGAALAAIQVLPLGYYLTRSPVWTDRVEARPSVWSVAPPRLPDAACTALPYLYGSQRRGQPNLAKALGVHNLNESAGGFAGLATLIWLAPAAWASRRRWPRVPFLAGLAALGALGAFQLPPVANVLRALPVLDVIDHRRLTLWIAFALVLLGGAGLDGLHAAGRAWGRWIGLWGLAAVSLVALAAAVGPLGPTLRARALDHYSHAASVSPGTDAALLHARAERQVRATLTFVPRYALFGAAQLATLAGLAVALRRGRVGQNRARGALLGLVLADLLAFGHGLNPAIARDDDRPEPAVIARLRRQSPPPARVLALGGELPPNILMRYGLADVRNYDSIEVARVLSYLDPLFEPDPSGSTARTSRREVTWDGVARTLDRLRAAQVAAVVSPTPPPPGLFRRIERVGAVWIGWMDGVPTSTRLRALDWDHGRIQMQIGPGQPGPLAVAEAFDPGWCADVDGRPVPVRPAPGIGLCIDIDELDHEIVFRYNPLETRLGAAVSGVAVVIISALLVGWPGSRRRRKNAYGAWKPAFRRVTIGLESPTRLLSPGPSHEG